MTHIITINSNLDIPDKIQDEYMLKKKELHSKLGTGFSSLRKKQKSIRIYLNFYRWTIQRFILDGASIFFIPDIAKRNFAEVFEYMRHIKTSQGIDMFELNKKFYMLWRIFNIIENVEIDNKLIRDKIRTLYMADKNRR